VLNRLRRVEQLTGRFLRKVKDVAELSLAADALDIVHRVAPRGARVALAGPAPPHRKRQASDGKVKVNQKAPGVDARPVRMGRLWTARVLEFAE
jgi:hypothetical protein